ncbi:MAG: nicotinate-nucleotide--dimethylbenzimidazole phosphoribosyltransferase, partial [Clostridiales bacterium]|nr:nicotinate-nucleotide--dimethylbenzimidazole phosphoribosyltransferase [Clostridiales bacterium]
MKMTKEDLQAYIKVIRPADEGIMDKARRRQAELAKPPGSLGRLEDISIRLAGITGQVCPRVENGRILVFAADNGVTAEGVSSAPQSVTLSQAVNMTRYKTGMSAMAHYFGNSVVVTDVGICSEVACPAIVPRKVRFSTGNIVREPAMTREET